MARFPTVKYAVGRYTITVTDKQIRIYEFDSQIKRDKLKWRMVQTSNADPKLGKVYLAKDIDGGRWAYEDEQISTFTLQEMKYALDYKFRIQIPQEVFDLFESRRLAERMIANG